jgi:quercetin dioxygenase-like cupin family protein
MNAYNFDDRGIRWNRFGDFEPRFDYVILNIDEKRRIADVLFKFPAQEQIALHRHIALNHTFVVQGNHRLYEATGELSEDRPTGLYKIIPGNEKPHREGGGNQDTVVFFSIRPDESDDLYELLDDAMNPIATVTFPMLIDLYRAQDTAVAAQAVPPALVSHRRGSRRPSPVGRWVDCARQRPKVNCDSPADWTLSSVARRSFAADCTCS